jgi:lipoprotein signal peptidase
MRDSRGRVPEQPTRPADRGQQLQLDAAPTAPALNTATPASRCAWPGRPWGVGAPALVIAGVVLVDQLAKTVAPWAPPYSHGAIIVVQNDGGTITVAGIELPLMTLLTATGLATFGRYTALSALRGRMPVWAVGLLVGGAVSNLLDRVAYGMVRDFLVTPWVIVNVADLAVMVGLCGVTPGFPASATACSRPRGGAVLVSCARGQGRRHWGATDVTAQRSSRSHGASSPAVTVGRVRIAAEPAGSLPAGYRPSTPPR